MAAISDWISSSVLSGCDCDFNCVVAVAAAFSWFSDVVDACFEDFEDLDDLEDLPVARIWTCCFWLGC